MELPVIEDFDSALFMALSLIAETFLNHSG